MSWYDYYWGITTVTEQPEEQQQEDEKDLDNDGDKPLIQEEIVTSKEPMLSEPTIRVEHKTALDNSSIEISTIQWKESLFRRREGVRINFECQNNRIFLLDF